MSFTKQSHQTRKFMLLTKLTNRTSFVDDKQPCFYVRADRTASPLRNHRPPVQAVRQSDLRLGSQAGETQTFTWWLELGEQLRVASHAKLCDDF